MSNKADAVAVEEHQHLLRIPALVTELDDLLEIRGEPAEESVEPFKVFVEARRELVEQGSEFVRERLRQRDEAVDLVSAIEQLLHVGDEAVDLDRIVEAIGCLLAPRVEGGG